MTRTGPWVARRAPESWKSESIVSRHGQNDSQLTRRQSGSSNSTCAPQLAVDDQERRIPDEVRPRRKESTGTLEMHVSKSAGNDARGRNLA